MPDAAPDIPAWIRKVGPDQLDDFIDWVDSTGGIEQPGFDDIQRAFVYVPGTQVDQTIDPFGATYFEQMIALYHELSGRTLDQEESEMTAFDLPNHVDHANPYASPAVDMMSGHVNAITAAIMCAELPAGARIADLGCGWGMTSEILAFCGSSVTAVDINPDFVKLVQTRADRLGNGIEARQSNFDDLVLPPEYDGVFFYECLHHAVKPWETLAQVAEFIKPDGKVFFAGEPINDLFWKSWGLRLDASAVYCIRKHGWFESGWSASFLHEMFRHIGWTLTLYPGIGLRGGDVGVARRGVTQTPQAVQVEDAPAPSEQGEAMQLRAALAAAKRERDHARRYPWKYIGNAWRQRRKGR
ncbi:MAG: class I SAM-dependent methyltransferase [Sulfitobacter sp.]